MALLKKIMRDLLSDAAKQPGVFQPAKQEGGLRMAVKVDGGVTSLKIGRDRVYPSDREWETVLRMLPYTAPVKRPQGRGVGADGRRWLWAKWPTPVQLALGLETRVQADEEEQAPL